MVVFHIECNLMLNSLPLDEFLKKYFATESACLLESVFKKIRIKFPVVPTEVTLFRIKSLLGYEV
jgi:hypothetical protein